MSNRWKRSSATRNQGDYTAHQVEIARDALGRAARLGSEPALARHEFGRGGGSGLPTRAHGVGEWDAGLNVDPDGKVEDGDFLFVQAFSGFVLRDALRLKE